MTVRRGATLAFALATTCAVAEAAGPRSAKYCGSCHGPIKRQWQSSTMATSWTDPLFQAFLAEAKSARGDSIQAACIACHAPLASVTGDLDVQGEVNRESVTCNFCHNVSDVDPSSRPASYTFDPTDPLKIRGPYDDADAGSAHASVESPVHTQSEFCAACHSYADESRGLVFEGTYPSWKASNTGARGMTCQSCHMPESPGKNAVNSKRTREAVSAHSFRGPHTPGALADSVVSLTVEAKDGRLRLTVRNRKAGHAIPGGGASMRSITLEVFFHDEADSLLTRVPVASYGTEFADAEGRAPVPKWLASRVARSALIPADSARVEWAGIPDGAKRAVASLRYHYVLPAYRAGLLERGVDLSTREPVVMATTEAKIP